MAKINLTPKKIYEQEFKTSMRGYDKTEVDEFLDDVIQDYTVYIALVKELQEENAKLKAKVTSASASRPAYASATSEPSHATGATGNIASASNYDILKRISRLEKEVFGKQIVE
ncbi:cell division regulator GpsB [Streptococcus thermophilus]|uniref:cell division regulator GpsB n=1 Tax=Streptococcus thermophilus TaxID=1308 RepID=UPI0002177381|nr:cell division regulator GpsB [Streptococcus thermophilus]CCC19075.1 cell cycle protein gpsB [Streptococcus thermophilus JIM 8232]